jgi:hypothetical protein
MNLESHSEIPFSFQSSGVLDLEECVYFSENLSFVSSKVERTCGRKIGDNLWPNKQTKAINLEVTAVPVLR